jgi:LacI family transcriptional regulator
VAFRPPHVAVLIETTHGTARKQVLGIADYLRQHGVRWELDHEPRRMEKGPPSWLSRWRGDGIIARVYSEKTLAVIDRLGVPVVNLWQGQPWTAKLPVCGNDDALVAQLAARHLMERGFRQFAFVGVQGQGWSAARGDAFAAFVASRRFPCVRFEFPSGGHSCLPPKYRSRQLLEWLRRQPLPLGLMAANDYYAAAVVACCRTAGIAVPEQVAIVGVDDDEAVCEMTSPMLTSVAIDHRRIGFEAARLLAQLMAGKPPNTQVVVPLAGLVCRQSSAGRAIEDPIVAAALETIRTRAMGPLTIDDLVARLGVSRTALTRAFAAEVGHGIHDEILEVRLREARRLLAESDLKLDAIARQSGFEHPQHLCRVFRQRLGVTPGHYRRTAKQAGKPG